MPEEEPKSAIILDQKFPVPVVVLAGRNFA
jgi:hypothetical protein